MKRLAIDVRPGEYAVARLDADATVPAALLAPGRQGLVSVTRTDGEVSLVCPVAEVPDGAKADAGWRLLTVRGPLAFMLTGVIAALSNELASAGVALVTLSTFETEHVLVKETDLARAVRALQGGGHEVHLPA